MRKERTSNIIDALLTDSVSLDEGILKRMGAKQYKNAARDLTYKVNDTLSRPEVYRRSSTGQLAQTCGRCAPIAVRLAKQAGYKIPSASELSYIYNSMRSSQNTQQKLNRNKGKTFINYTDVGTPSTGSLVFRYNGRSSHLTFEHYGKEFNYGHRSMPIVGRIHLQRNTEGLSNELRGCYTCGRNSKYETYSEGQCKKCFNSAQRKALKVLPDEFRVRAKSKPVDYPEGDVRRNLPLALHPFQHLISGYEGGRGDHWVYLKNHSEKAAEHIAPHTLHEPKISTIVGILKDVHKEDVAKNHCTSCGDCDCYHDNNTCPSKAFT
jgi:hypothetical protein